MPYATASDGIRIHYDVTGRKSAPPVLLIQGLGADKHGWIMQRAALSFGYRVIALDNRGAGRSDKPHGPYSLGQMAADAIAVLDDMGVERAHIVGASMGGAITQIVGVLYPDRVRSLTLACTACRNLPWREELLESWGEWAASHGMAKVAAEAARWVIGPRSFRRLAPALGWLGPLAFGNPAHGFVAQVEAIKNVDRDMREFFGVEGDMADELASIEVPTLVMVGNQDILTPRGDSEELAERIDTAELVVISGAAHGFMVEHATTFNSVLLDFLKRAERSYQRRVAAGLTAPPLRAVGIAAAGS